jgi:hypothetical protein
VGRALSIAVPCLVAATLVGCPRDRYETIAWWNRVRGDAYALDNISREVPQNPGADEPWGDRYGIVTDPFGQQWAIATHKEDVSPEELERRMAAMFATGAG